ncbi:MAG: hypothetical protein ABH950_03235 [Candidatus Altiarchaeota archaeon]
MDLFWLAFGALGLWFFASFYFMFEFQRRNHFLADKLRRTEEQIEDLKRHHKRDIQPHGLEANRVLEDVSKLENHIAETISADKHEQLKQSYWDMLQKDMKQKAEESGASKVSVLLGEKKKLEGMIELSRSKYHKGSIDEESFREISRDLCKRIIEIEAEMRLKNGGEKETKEG